MDFIVNRWDDIALALITSGSAAGFFWWLLQKTIETRLVALREKISQTMREELRRTGKVFDDQYIAMKDCLTFALRLMVKVSELESSFNTESDQRAGYIEEIEQQLSYANQYLRDSVLIFPTPLFYSFMDHYSQVEKELNASKMGLLCDKGFTYLAQDIERLQRECRRFLGIAESTDDMLHRDFLTSRNAEMA